MTFIYSQSFKVKQISIFKEKNYMLAANQKKKIAGKKTFAVDTKIDTVSKMASEFYSVYMVNNMLSIICKVPLVSLWSYWFWRVDQTLFVPCVN